MCIRDRTYVANEKNQWEIHALCTLPNTECVNKTTCVWYCIAKQVKFCLSVMSQHDRWLFDKTHTITRTDFTVHHECRVCWDKVMLTIVISEFTDGEPKQSRMGIFIPRTTENEINWRQIVQLTMRMKTGWYEKKCWNRRRENFNDVGKLKR